MRKTIPNLRIFLGKEIKLIEAVYFIFYLVLNISVIINCQKKKNNDKTGFQLMCYGIILQKHGNTQISPPL